MLRARPTRRFEVITTRTDMVPVLQLLAESGAVELETRALTGMRPLLPQLDTFLDELGALQKKYGRYWPAPSGTAFGSLDDPETVLAATLKSLHDWVRSAEPEIAQSQKLEAEAAELALAKDLVATAGSHPFAHTPETWAGSLSRAIYFVESEKAPPPPPEALLVTTFDSPGGQFIAAVGHADDMTSFAADMGAAKARLVIVPDNLFVEGEDHPEVVDTAIRDNLAAQRALNERLARISREHGLAATLARISMFRWLHDNRDEIQATERTVRITGWADPSASQALEQSLAQAQLDCIFGLAQTEDDSGAPMVLDNPAWLKAFEFFPRMLGIPGRGEADPSMMTALIASIMFGYMFGDVGQGAVLVGVGLWARQSMPLLSMLVPGGIMAMVFGVLFGSIFSREDIIPALWLHPLHEPITILAVSLGIGVVFLLLGIALDILQAVWNGMQANWIRAHGGVVVAYLSLLAVYWIPATIWGLPLGLALAMIGARDEDGHLTPLSAARGLGEFVETLMRLLVSSISFSRVGAFALAHAGLSAAIIGIAEAVGSVGYLVVLLLGNLLILALEGLVTGIQTTRLVLFEFFTRFYHASGREFVPLTLPDKKTQTPNGGLP